PRMSEKTVSPGSSTLPPSVPPRQGGAGAAGAPPTRVSATGRQAAVERGAEATAERTVERDTARPAEKAAPKAKPPGPRRVRLAVSRVDPWSVMKLAFLLAIAMGIGLVVATAPVRSALSPMAVLAEMRRILQAAAAMHQLATIPE